MLNDHLAEPPRLQRRDFLMAWWTYLYATWKAGVHSLGLKIVGLAIGVAIIAAATVLTAGEMVYVGAAVVALVVVVVVIAGGILCWNVLLPNRRVWALPGGRAIVTAHRTPRGWKPDNASAFPVGRHVAMPLLDAICEYADQTGAVLHGYAGNQALGQLYINRYGGTMRRTRLGRIAMERNPSTPTGHPGTPHHEGPTGADG